MIGNIFYTSLIEPKNIKEHLMDEFGVNAMQEELGQFARNESLNSCFSS